MILFRSPTVKRHTLRVVRNENFWKQMIFRAWPLKDTVRKIQREERRLASRLLEARTSCRTWTLEVLSRREIAAAVNFILRRSPVASSGVLVYQRENICVVFVLKMQPQQIEETTTPLAEITAASGFTDQAHCRASSGTTRRQPIAVQSVSRASD